MFRQAARSRLSATSSAKLGDAVASSQGHGHPRGNHIGLAPPCEGLCAEGQIRRGKDGRLVMGLLASLGAAAVMAGVLGAVVFYGGFIDVSADTPHEAIVFEVIQEARERSIARRARDVKPPVDLSDPERARRGAGNYQAMCVRCHLSPGMPDSELRRGLYPTPPDLTKSSIEQASSRTAAARRFWVIKHGIKASAMPAWSKAGIDDAALWDLTAFLGRLPDLSSEQYQSLVATSDGHAHEGMRKKGHHDAPAPVHVDKPGSKPHKH